VVIPSLPGYGFSGRPARAGVTCRYTAGLWHRLMRGLGYRRYGAHGGDFGAAVTTFTALDDPAPLLGIHLSSLDLAPNTGPGSRPLSAAEQAYLARYQRWRDEDRGYGAIQSTRPQTLSYGLNDSPAGLAAWVLEKWRGWADSGGDIEAAFSRDFLLTIVTLYWATQTIASSMRDYVDNRWLAAGLRLSDAVRVPTAVAVFHQFIDDGTPPRQWAERLYDIRRWTPMPVAATSRPPSNLACSAVTSQLSSTTWPPRRPARNDLPNWLTCARTGPVSLSGKQADIRRSGHSCCGNG